MVRYNNGIHAVFDEDVKLADTYAQDGAFISAASVLRKLADKLVIHAVLSPPALVCDDVYAIVAKALNISRPDAKILLLSAGYKPSQE